MLQKAVNTIRNAKRITVFTGAGISVESGIPPFRGDDGLWAKYDPIILDLDFYKNHTEQSWPVIKELFYDFFGKAAPNLAHQILAKWENQGIVTEIITQNIDNLHQEAGSNKVFEFHGTAQSFICTKCSTIYKVSELVLQENAPYCQNIKCKALLKPNFIFFGEGIPSEAYNASLNAAQKSDVFIVIGTTGEIMPASQIPVIAHQNGAKIIEINTQISQYTNKYTHIFLQGKATEVLNSLDMEMNN
ncbi:MAG: RNA polymerase subunit sigma [Bacteroidetes bacterium 4572_77]|nr:MAG: RNA polymerase subunit sigma [Bacteroidetes bacterium 4572_77]